MERGRFIVLEGQGFTGKSEQVRRLTSKLEGFGINVVDTRHPGGTEEGERLRQELLERKKLDPNLSPMEEFHLMSESIQILDKEVVAPALEMGSWVISDRFWDSVRLYQGHNAGVDMSLINEKASQATKPDLKILLSVEPEEIYRRILKEVKEQKREIHAFNQLDMDVLIGRHRFCLGLASANEGNNWIIVDGVGTRDEVEERAWKNVVDKFNLYLDRKLVNI